MTEERKNAILLATVILTPRKLQPLLEEDDREGKLFFPFSRAARCYCGAIRYAELCAKVRSSARRQPREMPRNQQFCAMPRFCAL
jgi:hypothetical protein